MTENSRRILFYKIINNLAVVPHSCLEEADERTRKNILKNFDISVTTLTHMDNRSFQTVLVHGMALLKTLQRPTLWIYLSLNYKIGLILANLSANIFVKESC